jgi:hypothetical protein
MIFYKSNFHFSSSARMIKKITTLLLAVACAQLTTIAQTPRTYTSSEILQQVKKLNVLGSVLYIAAHPDDENTRLLAYLANERNYSLPGALTVPNNFLAGLMILVFAKHRKKR